MDTKGEKFKELDRTEITNLMTYFMNIKYDNVEGI